MGEKKQKEGIKRKRKKEYTSRAERGRVVGMKIGINWHHCVRIRPFL
jgi:hypothetical protein